MYMPRLSLYKPNKSNDYEFLDRQINEMFTVGGTDIHVHKYLGPESPSEEDATADQPKRDILDETNIQDLLFLENRDRKYDSDIYSMRGIYNVQDIDFDLSQFGLFLSNDTLFMTVHIRSSVKTLGRKLMSGDVIELPHLKDEYALNDFDVALKRFYVIEDVTRAAEGFTQTWYPHLYRLKLKQIVDSQEYKDILDRAAKEDDLGGGPSLRDVLSTYNKEKEINDAVVLQAEADAPKSGYDISHYYTLSTDSKGNTSLTETVGDDGSTVTTSSVSPAKEGYNGYLLGDGGVPDGSNFGHGISFTLSSATGDFFLRTDFAPNRLFSYAGTRWVKYEDNVRMTLTNTDNRNTQKGTFMKNTATNTIGGKQVPERQSLSKALRPKADN